MLAGRRSLLILAIVAVCLVGTLLTISPPASAQAATKLHRVEVVLWPEYDRPAVLVIYRVQLPRDQQLPTVVELKTPASAGVPHAVAKRVRGLLVNAEHTTSTEGDWTTVRLQTDQPEVQLEYYAALDTSQATRKYTFQWAAGVEVEQLAYEVQVPVGASGLQITPPATSQTPGRDGLEYARAELGAYGADRQASISVSYDKKPGPLSAEVLRQRGVHEQQPAPPSAPGPMPPVTAPLQAPKPGGDTNWILIAALVAVAFMAGMWVTRSGRSTAGRRGQREDDEEKQD